MKKNHTRTLGALLGGILVLAPAAFANAARPAVVQEEDEELLELLREERAEAARLMRRGDVKKAISRLNELIDEEPEDAESRALRARCRLELAQYERALADAKRALTDALKSNTQGSGDVRAECARTVAETLLETGEAEAAIEALSEIGSDFDPQVRARDAWLLGRALLAVGRRDEAFAAWRSGGRTKPSEWVEQLAKGRCQQRLGLLQGASRSFVKADTTAQKGEGAEADVLVALADLYFEADREVAAAKHRSPGQLYDEALRIHPGHEGALLGLFELHRYNWRLQRRSASDILGEILDERPDSIDALVAGCAADLEDGKLPSVRRRLARLHELAPKRRDVRTMDAALAWVEHRRDDCAAILAELAETDPNDAVPQREVGRHLLELYRFAEGVEFLERAIEIDDDDHIAWQELGRALANTGREEEARKALETAVKKAAGRQDAWRDNTARVLEKMDADLRNEDFGDLAFRWSPAAGDVFRAYLVPFYKDAREEFSSRYGFTSPPTLIEIFEKHEDFSVRSTGFQGFPALGVCFGPVVTAVSPTSEMRGTFSWARTAFHEFSHVVHLGISHNRCPRWITEGLATWEEVNRNPTWSRNLRRELIDSRAANDIIPVRDLNRAFRGPRILFGYYEGGLLCEMLIEDHGFPPMIHLLKAFDRGLDLDQAFDEVFHMTPEEVDVKFDAFLEKKYGHLALEARWQPSKIARLRLLLEKQPPKDEGALASWVDDWTTVAWGSWQARNKVDAQEALRRVKSSGAETSRMLFLEGEIALANNQLEEARRLWKRGLELGGDDFRVRMGLGSLALGDGEAEEAEEHYKAAERCFPGYDDVELSAELRLADLYESQDRKEDEMRARERWLAFNAGVVTMRREVADWHFDAGRFDDAARYYREANDVDLFLRDVHTKWGKALRESGRHEEAVREFGVALIVPTALDVDEPGPLSDEDRAELLGLQALSLVELGRTDEALEKAREALELDSDCESAREVVDRVK